MNLESHALTTTGRRANNEDNLCDAAPLGLFAVADGLGGYEGGEVASALAMETLRAFIERHRRDPGGTWPCREDKKRTLAENLLRAGAVAAHDAIKTQRQGTLRQMGSTIAALYVFEQHAAVAHVGDSRVYRLRGGVLTALTRDHSLWAELVATGRDVPPRHEFPFKNQITRALGLDGDAAADTSLIELAPGDRYLLCTDGLYDPFEDDALGALLREGTPAACCEHLVAEAWERGSSDNITAVIVDVAS
jgi:serine/threonine protein phosphatase PrpC